MKKIMALITLSILSLSSYSQTSSTEITNNSNSLANKSFEIGLSVIKNSYQSDMESISGLEASAGKIFNLTNELSTTSSLLVNYSRLSVSDTFDSSFSMTEIGFAQKLSFNIKNIIVPFVELGISTGSSQLTVGEESLSNGYIELLASLGLQVVVTNNFRPFLKYSKNSMKPDGMDQSTSLSVLSFGVAFLL